MRSIIEKIPTGVTGGLWAIALLLMWAALDNCGLLIPALLVLIAGALLAVHVAYDWELKIK